MASPNADFTEMVTTTLRNHPGLIADNVSNHNALYRQMKRKGKVKKSGGYEIVLPLDYQENSTYQRYSGYDLLDISQSDVLTSAKYEWVQAAVNVTASGREMRMNNSKEKIADLVKARMKNAMRTAANNMSTDMYSDGTATNQMGGLAHLIQSDPTASSTVGGINQSTYSWWRNQIKELDGTGTYADIRADMNDLWLLTVRGNDKPDMIVSTHDLYSAYWEQLSDQQRYTKSDDADTFENILFRGVPVFFDDDDTNFTTTGETMYFINTDYLQVVCHPQADWSVQEEKVSVNQDAIVVPIIFQGQMTCSNRARQGRVIDLT